MVLQRCMYLFCCQGHLKHFLENYGFCQKSESDTYSKGWGRGVMSFAALWCITYKNRYVTHPYLKNFVTIEKMDNGSIILERLENGWENV